MMDREEVEQAGKMNCEGGGLGASPSYRGSYASIVVNAKGEPWRYEDYQLGDLWIPMGGPRVEKAVHFDLPDDGEVVGDEIILSECIIKFMKNPPELARRLLVLVVLTILDITVTKAIPSSLPGWTPLVTEMSYLERKVKDECDMPWKIGFRVLLEPLFAYGGVALMVSCVLGRAFLMLFLTDGGGFLDSLALTTLPSVACNLAALTLFGKVPSPVAHTSFVSALFGVLVRRISRVLLYRKPKKGFRPVGVVLQFFSLGVVLFSMSVVLAVITADMLLAVEPKIPSIPAKATFAAIIFGNEVNRS
ncbi:hypothetical protein FOZ62_027596, partial [Perkinsus olseni]